MNLRTKRLGKYWWIVGDEEDGPYGPYAEKKDAEKDRLGLLRTAKYEHLKGFITTTKVKTPIQQRRKKR